MDRRRLIRGAAGMFAAGSLGPEFRLIGASAGPQASAPAASAARTVRTGVLDIGYYDVGGRAACIAAALHPDRVRAAVLIGGYTIQNTIKPGPPAPPEAARRLWYQWYFNTDAGRAGLEQNRRELCRSLWREWSPTWRFTDETYNATARSFDNSDFVDCVIHSYKHRNFNAPGEPRFLEVERQLATRPPIGVPTTALYGEDDPFGRSSAQMTSSERTVLPQIVGKRIVEGAGHFLPREKPDAVAAALVDLLASARER